MVQVRIPGPLRAHTADIPEVAVAGENVGAALGFLVERYPQLRRHLFDERGSRRGFVNVFVNEQDVPVGTEAAATLRDGDVITIVPSIAGG